MLPNQWQQAKQKYKIQQLKTSESTVTEKPSKKELSKEDQQEIAEKGKQFLDDMFTQMGLTVVIEKMMTKDKITFQVHGEDLGILIGKHGQTLDAIQYLTISWLTRMYLATAISL